MADGFSVERAGEGAADTMSLRDFLKGYLRSAIYCVETAVEYDVDKEYALASEYMERAMKDILEAKTIIESPDYKKEREWPGPSWNKGI